MRANEYRWVGPDLSDGARQCVYFVRPEGRHFVKVGHGCPIKSRLRDIQCGSPEMLEILLVIPGGKNVEMAMHRALCGTCYRGEWFHESTELLALIEMLTACDGDYLGCAQDIFARKVKAFRQRARSFQSLPFGPIEFDTVLPLSSAGRKG